MTLALFIFSVILLPTKSDGFAYTSQRMEACV